MVLGQKIVQQMLQFTLIKLSDSIDSSKAAIYTVIVGGNHENY